MHAVCGEEQRRERSGDPLQRLISDSACASRWQRPPARRREQLQLRARPRGRRRVAVVRAANVRVVRGVRCERFPTELALQSECKFNKLSSV